jgi:hypothetical protein
MMRTSGKVITLGAALVLSVLVAFTASGVYAIKLNEKDYIITDFGIASGNPFITVQGTAGGSYDPSMGDEGYEAYVFDTDKGFFQVTVAEGESEKPYYSADHLLVKGIKLNECLLSESTHGKPHFDNNTVQYIDNNQNFTRVNKAFAIQVSVDDPDGKCKTGEHIQKIFPNQTTVMKTQVSKTTSPVVKNTTFVGETLGAVDIDTSNGEYRCNGSPRMGKINGLFVDAYDRHGTLAGNWTFVNEKSNGEDTTGKITGGTVSMSSYNLTGKSIRDAICPTIYDRITISGECGEAKLVEMKTSDGRPIASLNGNARCSLN